MTNADRIRNMSDEELTEFINNVSLESMDTISYGTKEYDEIWEHETSTLEWLRSEEATDEDVESWFSKAGDMEDRYLFKAKRLDNGEWVTGQYVNTCYPKDCKKTGHFIVKYPNHLNEIYTSTICQCTGLKDKNGKLIWENDIVKCRLGKVMVLWEEAEWKIKEHDDFIWYKDLYYWVISDRNAEVIGNIFDNPELL